MLENSKNDRKNSNTYIEVILTKKKRYIVKDIMHLVWIYKRI